MREGCHEPLGQTRARLIAHTLKAYAQLQAAQRAGHPFPPLYAAGVRYRREPRGHDDWLLPADVLAGKGGKSPDSVGADCEDLAAWRCAELWLAGVRRARPEVKQVRPGLKHAFVVVGKTKLDPSRKLGMPYKRRRAQG